MTLYYKLAFKPFFDKWKSTPAKKRLNGDNSIFHALIAFCNVHFPGLVCNLPKNEQFQFVEQVKMLVLSHRHNKNDAFMRDPLVDFTVVRDPMYKYSKQTQDKFFSFATYAFLFAWFQKSNDGQAFAIDKFSENSD